MNKGLLKEKRIHGDVMFPLDVYPMRYTNPKSTLDCHWHDELELLILTEGRAVFQIEASSYPLEKGQAVFINSGEIHTAFPVDADPWGFNAIVFNANLLLGMTYDSIQKKYVEPLLKSQIMLPRVIDGKHEWEQKVLKLLSDTVTLFWSRQHTYELVVKAYLYQILSELLLHSEPRTPDKDFSAHLYRTERLKMVLSFIHENYHRKLNLSELAKQVNMSEGHFCRLFKQMVNKTPIEYINFFRINKAVRLLEETNTKIIEIAMEVGFDNFSYFINIFKHYTNCTPSEYRRKLEA